MKKLSVIIPVYNEKHTIVELIMRVQAVTLVDWEKEIIVIDDGSTDGTVNILKNLDYGKYVVIFKNKNEGKGAAIKTGLAAASGDYVVFQDADLEYDPKDYPVLIAPLEREEAEMVIGSRVLSDSIHLFGRKRVHFSTYFGCMVIASLINLLYGKSGTDYYGCYKAIDADLLKSIPIRANGFEYDSELLCKLLKRGVVTTEVPISYHPRGHAGGKKLKFWRDGFRVVYSIVRWRFQD